MRAIVAAMLLLQSTPESRDSWFGVDKIKHFFVSAFIQSVSYSALRTIDVSHRDALIGASCVTAGFAIGKEIHDMRHGAFFSTRDLVWDAAGAATSVVLIDRTRR